MDDLLLMRVLHRFEHLEKQLQASPDPETMRITPFVQRAAFNVLHRQIKQPVGIDSRIVQTRDVRMLEARQDVALSGKALLEIGTQVTWQRQLQRHFPPESAIGTPREPHFGHTTVTEWSNQLVRSDACADLQPACGGRSRFGRAAKRRPRGKLLELRELSLSWQQRVAQCLGKVPVLGWQSLEPRAAPGRVEWQRLIQETAHPRHLGNR